MARGGSRFCLDPKQVEEIRSALAKYRRTKGYREDEPPDEEPPDLEPPNLLILPELKRRRGRPSLARQNAEETVGYDLTGPTPVRLIRIDGRRAQRVIGRERHLLKLKSEFGWLLRLLDLHYVPQRIITKVQIQNGLQPLRLTREWLGSTDNDELRGLAWHLAEHRRSRSLERLSWSQHASLWLFRIEKSREGTLREALRFVDDLKKRTKRADTERRASLS